MRPHLIYQMIVSRGAEWALWYRVKKIKNKPTPKIINSNFCSTAYCRNELTAVVGVHFFTFFLHRVLLSTTCIDCLLGLTEEKRFVKKQRNFSDTREKTQSTCWFWVSDNPAFVISYSVHNVCREKKNDHRVLYNILRSYFWVEKLKFTGLHSVRIFSPKLNER